MKMRKSIFSVAVSLGAVSLLFAGNAFATEGVPPSAESDSIVPELTITSTCNTKRSSFASNDTNTTITSTAFVDIPGMLVSFSIPGALSTCLTVHYSGQTFAPGGATGLMVVRAVLDDALIGHPGEVQMVGGNAGPYSNSHANQWVYTNVAPGFHQVKMQFRSFFGSSVSINKGTMTVHHK